MAERAHFAAQGLILAGGFVKHPFRDVVRLAAALFGRIPAWLLVRGMYSFTSLARCRYRRSPETLATIDEFIARRTEPDRQAAMHRLRLIAQNDPRPIARRTRLPVFYLSGFLDPIVPWPLVRPWLAGNCPTLRGCRILFYADHNVLGTAPRAAAAQVLAWMRA